jgi:hypothetical protein
MKKKGTHIEESAILRAGVKFAEVVKSDLQSIGIHNLPE